ncbi:primosomal protein N' [Candidatus Margulisiibacteriota bacterium]
MLQLTDHQQKALQIIAENQLVLLHGVTGSGKTEVYIRAARQAVDAGQQVIVLVPEISLTPQTVERFSLHFKTAVIHSHLSRKQRVGEWQKILNGDVEVVIGARSALFAPVKNLGLIVLDEEHDPSFKQDVHPHYHAREVAIKRAELTGAKVILGSATPSLESYFRAVAPTTPPQILRSAAQNDVSFTPETRWQLAELPERIDHRPLPPVEIADMREELKSGNRTVLSRRLKEELKKTIAEGKQAILFQNRRGFSTFLLCRECGLVVECPKCAVSMTYHKDGKTRCHYCGHEAEVPPVCPQCTSKYFRFFGTGTQKVESELTAMFPDVKVIRMDKDTTGKKNAHARLLGEFAAGEGGILLGTQMITKGFDFPNVRLVGVISADTALNLPDFRAAERTFQLLTQVSGRAGRSKETKDSMVIVQTYHPDHYAIQAAAGHDYQKFYLQEMDFRRELEYPPFTNQVLITVSSRNKKAASEVIPGLIPAPISRLRGEYRFQRLLEVGEIPDEELEKLSDLNIPGIKIDIDIDPVNMM